MTYDNWKCTDPNDRYLGRLSRNSYNSIEDAWRDFEDGEISLDDMGEALLEDGWRTWEARECLSRHTQYPIPVGYFGEE